MDWRILAASIAGGILGSMADWLFAGILFHERYQRHPEVWRSGTSETLKIGVSQALCLLTSFGFVLLAAMLGPLDLIRALKLAALIWLIVPLPLLVTNSMFIKIDPLVTASHAAGWLAKLLLIALATAIIM